MNNKGFTMAELLIVVAIIAVLIAAAVPIFISQKEKGNETGKPNSEPIEKVEEEQSQSAKLEENTQDRLDTGDDINISGPESASSYVPAPEPTPAPTPAPGPVEAPLPDENPVEAPVEAPIESVEPAIQVGDPDTLEFNGYY